MRILPTARAIVREGGVLQLYRGGLPEIVGLIPRSSAMWSGYEISRREMVAMNGGVCTTPIVAAAGAVGGCCEGLAFSPFQVVKVRLMAKEHLGRGEAPSIPHQHHITAGATSSDSVVCAPAGTRTRGTA